MTFTSPTFSPRVHTVKMTSHATASVGASTFEVDVPATLYQTRLTPDGRQDSSSLQKLMLALSSESAAALSAAVAGGADVSTLVHGAVRRFDMTELQQYDAATGTMLGLRLPAAVFEYDLQGARLSIGIHRKELPVSRSYGDSPLAFVFIILPTNEVVVTSPVIIGSKQPSSTAPRAAPKRPRPPPPTRPVVAPAAGTEAVINDLLSAKRVRVVEPEAAAPMVPPPPLPRPAPPLPRPAPPLPGVASPVLPECPSPYFGLPESGAEFGVDVLSALPVELLLADW